MSPWARNPKTQKRAWKPAPRVYTKHGITPLRRAIDELRPRLDDPDWLDGLGPVGVALRAWREDLIDSLDGAAGGGPPGPGQPGQNEPGGDPAGWGALLWRLAGRG